MARNGNISIDGIRAALPDRTILRALTLLLTNP
jgi:hypothetical protein